jgi:very-short-patch-repair endonuclease
MTIKEINMDKLDNYICEVCGKEFVRKTKKSSKRFCSKECRYKSAGKKISNLIQEKIANGSFVSSFVDYHKSKGHGQKQISCRFCNQVFNTKNKLYEHYHLVHNIPSHNRGWTKGMTKENNETLKLISEKLKNKPSKFKGTHGLRKYKPHTEEYKKMMSEVIKHYYQLHPEKHPARRLANNRNHMTYGEQIVFDWLIQNNITFQHNYHHSSSKINRFVDFFIPSKKLFIEVDGEYWHKDRKELDAKKDEDATECGFQTIRIPAKSNIVETLKQIFVPIG